MNIKSIRRDAILGITIILLPVFLYSQEEEIEQRSISVTAREFFDNYLYLLEDKETIVIDGRTQEMFSDGHLKNAINIDADDPDFLELIQPYLEKPRILVYCTTVRRTTKIVNFLTGIYDGEIIYICDGIRGWLQNGYPVWGIHQLSPDNWGEEVLQKKEN
jgi:phage shock protein E